MPSTVYIKDGKVLDEAPEKVWKEKEPDHAILAALHYDNTPPKNPDGTERIYDNKRHDLASAQYKKQEENRKKNS